MSWHEVGRIALLLVVWAGLAPLRGPTCPLSWRLAAEMATAVGVAWFASDSIAIHYFPRRDEMEPWELGGAAGTSIVGRGGRTRRGVGPSRDRAVPGGGVSHHNGLSASTQAGMHQSPNTARNTQGPGPDSLVDAISEMRREPRTQTPGRSHRSRGLNPW